MVPGSETRAPSCRRLGPKINGWLAIPLRIYLNRRGLLITCCEHGIIMFGQYLLPINLVYSSLFEAFNIFEDVESAIIKVYSHGMLCMLYNL
jgi:hypothetical protein